MTVLKGLDAKLSYLISLPAACMTRFNTIDPQAWRPKPR